MIADAMSQAIDEAITGKEEDSNGVHFFYAWSMRMDDAGRNIPGTGAWKPHILIMSASHRNQEVRRPAKEADAMKYPMKWARFHANAANELLSLSKSLDEQVASLRALTGNVSEPAPKRKGRPPKLPQVNGVPPNPH